ncbi:hypothetical protein OQY15_13415 [Pedobacter sp. MC2016-15]|uniref:hypothetical protein n=1 Tax=Pedobacter sp. MC2016-15 TaxID=2994473 RepID=UPI002244FCC3|nr:hypothetical protein [Pedobacter sp. MC2016-15]MCX2480093.1 hypothetical protein [Pedobacter sp. MC2016-15]
MPDFSPEHSPNPFQLLKKGKYVFTDLLEEKQDPNASVPYFTAKAIIIEENPDNFTGDVAHVRLSDLILKQSSYIDENGKIIEAHKLYTWPRNLGSTPQWTAAKQEFLNQFILNFPIEILSLQEHGGVTWRFISPEQFKKLPANINASPEFQDFAAHKNDYFFLRQPLNEPK